MNWCTAISIHLHLNMHLNTLRILLFLAAACQLGYSKPFDSQVKFCSDIYISHQTELTDKFGIGQLGLKLNNAINGCQYVYGDVELNNFGVSTGTNKVGGNFDQLKTDFFNSIEEIAGSLIIFNVNLRVLEFKNLRVIWGRNLKMGNYNGTNAIKIYLQWPLTLRLPKLVAVANGNVVLLGSVPSSTYRYLKHKIDWKLLFQDESKQQFLDTAPAKCDASDCTGAPTCSQECQSSSASNCWSGGSEGCQCTRHACNAYQHFKDGANCHKNCLGGCSGSGPESCIACMQFNRQGSCANRCSEGDDDSLLPLLDLNLCVKACPLPFLNRQKACVAECSDYELPIRKRCETCSGCNRVCKIETRFLSDEKARELKAMGCKAWKAFEKFSVGSRGGSRDGLAVLNNLSAFYGTLMITGVDKLGVDRIDFLRNLQFVSYQLMLFRMKVKYLGLGQLRYARDFLLWDIGGLCKNWYPTNHIERFQTKHKRVAIKNIEFDTSSSECLNARCHAACGTGECWGPHADMCAGEIWEN